MMIHAEQQPVIYTIFLEIGKKKAGAAQSGSRPVPTAFGR